MKAFVESFDRAFNSKDMTRLTALCHPDMTIFEGGHVNTGWADQRDNHLGPELQQMAELQLAHVGVAANLLSDAAAYVTAEYRLKATVKGKAVESEGLETLVLVKSPEETGGSRHSHTSSRRRPAVAAAKP